MCAEIFEYREQGVLEYARDLGVALQLTNILRDVVVDYRNGRRYLPDEDLERAGCTWADIEREVSEAGQGLRSPKVRTLLQAQAVRAREYFARAVRALPREDARRFVPAEIMRGVYWSLLERIERADFDVFSDVIRVPRPAQAMIAIGAWWRTR
jgi:phytoene synthase